MIRKYFIRAIGAFTFIAIWEILTVSDVLPKALIDQPGTVFIELLQLLAAKPTWLDIGATLSRTVLGFGLAAAFGIPIGLLMGYSLAVRNTLEFIIDFFRSIPATALLPLFIVLFDVGDSSKIALVAFSCSTILIVYTMYGVVNGNVGRRLYAKTVGASTSQVLLKVIFFDALPHTFAGVRVSVSLALVLVIVAEMVMFGTQMGLGLRIANARLSSSYTEMYALIMITGLVGFGLNFGCHAIGIRYIHWAGK